MPATLPDPENDELNLFSEDEYFRVLCLLEPEEDARRTAREWAEPNVDGRPRILSPDIAALLLVVSEDCALRAARLLNLSPEAAFARRAALLEILERLQREGKNPPYAERVDG